MKYVEQKIQGVYAVMTERKRDERGVFSRLFCQAELKPILDHRKINQINISTTDAVGTIRGMHFQVGQSKEMKLIRCLKGRVWDAFIDLRSNSPTFLKWDYIELSSAEFNMIILPEGIAHGFQTLEADCHMLYLHTASYNPDFERGIRYNDPQINIQWPLQLTRISDRDKSFPYLDLQFEGI